MALKRRSAFPGANLLEGDGAELDSGEDPGHLGHEPLTSLHLADRDRHLHTAQLVHRLAEGPRRASRTQKQRTVDARSSVQSCV